jgi:multidrug resistance efflux pump
MADPTASLPPESQPPPGSSGSLPASLSDPLPPDQERPSWARNLTRGTVTTILIGMTGAALFSLYVYTDINPSTDDAYVFANVVGVACRVDGPIVAVHVRDNQLVRKGDLLIEVDPATFAVAVDHAKADLATKEAEAANARQYADRVKIMASRQFMSPNDLENAEAAAAATTAARDSARANLREAELNLQYTRLYAPVDGVITNFRISPGVYVRAGEQIFALIDMDSWFVSAFFKETVVRSIQPNQRAEVTLSMYPGKVFRSHVEGVAWGTYEPDGSTVRLLPEVRPTVDWVRLAMRFPVRIPLDGSDPQFPLRIGARAVVTIKTLSTVSGPAPYPSKPTIWDWLPWN